MALTLSFTKTSPTHHSFRYARDDGSGEILLLESKGLMHDFLHLLLESEARLEHSFYGMLAEGKRYADIASHGPDPLNGKRDEAELSKLIVEGLAGMIQHSTAPHIVLGGLENILSAYKQEVPSWATENFLFKIQSRYRSLWGQWKSIPLGETLTLSFPI